ncbi:MAG: DUF1365 domain-containing protein [Kofleriaceae bacterium]|nr:DUF1365 domain-containing protein [Kofleriaceae bacterium]MCL4227830.1 DUF1365 family protein [Myxococcales bacterium]
MSALARSALYVGRVRHRRFAPVVNAFTYPLYLTYLDLDEVDACDAALWPLFGVRRPAVARWRAADHLAGLGRPGAPLAEVVRDAVAATGAPRPRGPIGLLTHARHLGHAMNPVSFFYCWDPAGRVLDAVVAEVSNTPWDERHVYVLPAASALAAGAGTRRFRFAKAFHVSPFLPMDLGYDWRFTPPGDALSVHMDCLAPATGEVVLDATLTLRRRPLDRRHLAAVLARFPLMTGEVVARIYWQALRLWLKRAPVFTHPATAAAAAPRVAPPRLDPRPGAPP